MIREESLKSNLLLVFVPACVQTPPFVLEFKGLYIIPSGKDKKLK